MSHLRHKLAEIRRRREREGRKPRKRTSFGRVDTAERSEVGEHPTILGLKWLGFVGEALRQLGVCWNWRVSAEHWEKSGCVSLYLQRVVHEELPQTKIFAGRTLTSKAFASRPMGGGAWERLAVPIGVINGHDQQWAVRAILRALNSPKDADIILAGSSVLRAMRGL